MFLFLIVDWDHFISSTVLHPPKIDPGLFIRPFTNTSWTVIFVITFIQICLLFLPAIIVKNNQKKARRRLKTSHFWHCYFWCKVLFFKEDKFVVSLNEHLLGGRNEYIPSFTRDFASHQGLCDINGNSPFQFQGFKTYVNPGKSWEENNYSYLQDWFYPNTTKQVLMLSNVNVKQCNAMK